MLITRQFRNNVGYQVDVERQHPIYVQRLKRYNANEYFKEGDEITMSYNRGSSHGMQYGGKACGQKGGGLNTYIEALNMLMDAGKTGLKMYSSETATKLKNSYGNMMKDNNPNWRPGFAGEKHMMNKQGLTYNYCGPGTNLSARLARGDPGLDKYGVDEACKVHDIEYYNAKTWNQVREADKKLVEAVDKSGTDFITKNLIKGMMKAKMFGEDIGVVKASDFTSFPNMQDDLPKAMEQKQPTTDISGKGIVKPRADPAYKLKNKVKKYKTQVKKGDRLMKIAFDVIKKRLNK